MSPIALPENGTVLPVTTLRDTSFLWFWFARVMSVGAFQMVSVVIGWQVYALTGSVLNLGLVGLCQFLPMLVLTLPAGHIADRYPRKNIIRLCQWLEAFTIGLLALASYSGIITTPMIFVAATIIGAARTFEMPATASLLPLVVPGHLFPRAIALTASAVQMACILGPAIGGALYIFGAQFTYAVVALLYLAASGFIASLKVTLSPQKREPMTVKSLLSGFAFIKSQPIVLGAISLDMMAVLLGGATALLPVFAHDILHAGPIGLGFLRAGPSIGALLMSLLLARFPLQSHVGTKMFSAVLVFGAATILFGLSENYILSLVALFFMGAADIVSVVVRTSLVQLATPDAMRGRVSAVNAMFIGTSNQLGEFESGVTAALFGTVPAVVIGGFGTILVAILWARIFRQLRQAQSFARHSEAGSSG